MLTIYDLYIAITDSFNIARYGSVRRRMIFRGILASILAAILFFGIGGFIAVSGMVLVNAILYLMARPEIDFITALIITFIINECRLAIKLIDQLHNHE